MISTDLFAQHHHAGGTCTTYCARKKPSRSAIRHKADVDEGLKEIGTFPGKYEIAGQREAASYAGRRTIYRTYNRNWSAQNHVDCRVVMVLQSPVTSALAVQGTTFPPRCEVGTRAKTLACPGDQHSAAVAQVVESLAKFVRHLRCHRIQPVRPI